MALKTSMRYVLSFLLIALLCIFAVAVGANVLYGDYSRNQIEEKYLANFSASQRQADNQLEDLNSYFQQLSEILPLYAEGTTLASAEIDAQTLSSLMGNFEGNSADGISLAFFLRAEPQFIYTSMGKSPYLDYEDRLRSEGIDADMSELFSNLLTVRQPLLYRPKSLLSGTQGKLILLYPLGSAWSDYPATLMAILDDTLLTRYFSAEQLDAVTSLYALGTSGQVVLSSPAPGTETLGAQVLYEASGSGVQQEEVDGKELVFIRTASTTGLLTYVAVMEQGDFYSQWYMVNARLNAVAVLTLCFAGALSLVMGYLVYAPVRRAYTRVTGRAPTGRSADELETIVSVYERTRENVSELEDLQETQTGIIRRQFMLGLINGTIKGAHEFEGYRESLMMRLDRLMWLSMYLLLPDESADTDRVLEALESFRLTDGEVLFAECRWEKGIGLVVNFERPDRETAPMDVAREVMNFLRERVDGGVQLGVGSLESDPMRMGTSFYRATVTLKEALPQPGGAIVAYQEKPLRDTLLCLDTTLLAEGITYGNKEVALASLQDMVARIHASHERVPITQLMRSDILNTVVRYAQKQGLTPDKTKLCATAQMQTIEEFHQGARQLIEEICSACGQRRIQDSVQNRSRVISFIAANYKRNDLSLKLLSDEVGMSMSKINILLKENLGCSFVQYVSLLRLNEVKRLLRETDDSIQTIVQSVGYIDVSSFMRKFKQVEGVSPGQYRAQHRK